MARLGRAGSLCQSSTPFPFAYVFFPHQLIPASGATPVRAKPQSRFFPFGLLFCGGCEIRKRFFHASETMDAIQSEGVERGAARDELMFHPGPPCSTLVRPAGRPPRFRGGPPTERATFGRFLPLWTPHTVRLCHPEAGISKSMRGEG
jgi:hypothetical protein